MAKVEHPLRPEVSQAVTMAKLVLAVDGRGFTDKEVLEAVETMTAFAKLREKCKAFARDVAATVAIEASLIMPPMVLLIVGGLWLGMAEIQIMGIRQGVMSVAAQAQSTALDQPGAAAIVCAVTPAKCNAITVTFDPGSSGGVGTVTASLNIDLSVIPFLNLGSSLQSATAQWHVP